MAADHHFEGPEKILEVEFGVKESAYGTKNLRNIPRAKWDTILREAKCEILSKCSNDVLDSYVLSESSLFVYKDKFMIKTCGTTTLLLSLEPVVKEAEAMGMEFQWISYSRKDFKFPTHQSFPHKSFSQESNFLQAFCRKSELKTSSFVLGDVSSDHCCVFLGTKIRKPQETGIENQRFAFNVMMYGLDPLVSAVFHRAGISQMIEEAEIGRSEQPEEKLDAEPSLETLKKEGSIVRHLSGMDSLIGFEEDAPSDKSKFDDIVFDPCGYSSNVIRGKSLCTVHVTPEEHCSYASVETSKPMNAGESQKFLDKVLKLFRPSRFTVTFYGGSEWVEEMEGSPLDKLRLRNGDKMFGRTGKCVSTFTRDFVCQLANFEVYNEV